MENPLWRNSKWVSKFIAMAIACLASVWVVVPFLWAIENSLKTDLDISNAGQPAKRYPSRPIVRKTQRIALE